MNSFFVSISPTQLQGRIAHFDASISGSFNLSASNISQWSDISGNGNHIVQATTANQPTYSISGLNSKPAVMFNGGNQYLLNTAITQSYPVSIFVVGQQSNNNFGCMMDSADSTNSKRTIIGVNGSNNLFLYSSTGAEADSTSNWKTLAHCGVANFTSSHTLYSDGAQVATETGGVNTLTGLTVGTGEGTSNVQAFGGNISELIVFSRILTLQEISLLHYYSQRKWGTP